MPDRFRIHRRNELMAKNVGLVRAVVARLGIEPTAAVYDDCIQEGTIALWKAAERYQADRGAFSSFAWAWIDGAVKTCLCRAGVVSEPVKRVSKRAAENARERNRASAGACFSRSMLGESRFDEGEYFYDAEAQTACARRLPECLIDRDVEERQLGELDSRVLEQAIRRLPRAERETVTAALRGIPISHYAKRRRWGRRRVRELLQQATDTLSEFMADTDGCGAQ